MAASSWQQPPQPHAAQQTPWQRATTSAARRAAPRARLRQPWLAAAARCPHSTRIASVHRSACVRVRLAPTKLRAPFAQLCTAALTGRYASRSRAARGVASASTAARPCALRLLLRQPSARSVAAPRVRTWRRARCGLRRTCVRSGGGSSTSAACSRGKPPHAGVCSSSRLAWACASPDTGACHALLVADHARSAWLQQLTTPPQRAQAALLCVHNPGRRARHAATAPLLSRAARYADALRCADTATRCAGVDSAAAPALMCTGLTPHRGPCRTAVTKAALRTRTAPPNAH